MGNRVVAAAKKQLDYYENMAEKNPSAALGHLLKADAFVGRLVAPLIPAVSAEVSEPAEAAEPLSPVGAAIVASSPQWALLNEIGFSPDKYVTTNPDGSQVVAAISPEAIMAAANDQQERELALLGVFGTPGAYPDIDYSLFEQYYQRVGASNNWEPKEEYATTGTWQAYLADRG